MKTIHFPAGTHNLGWRHTLPADARAGVESFLPWNVFMDAFSPARQVALAGFEIQAEPIHVDEILGEVSEDEYDAILDLDSLCDLVDGRLAPSGWRLPTEDELEATLAGGLFSWGEEIPAGSPYSPGEFERHRLPTAQGLVMPHDTYEVELVRAAFMMGDGGSAVCGDYAWPVAWLTLSPCARVPAVLLDDLWIWMEGAKVHPVRGLQGLHCVGGAIRALAR